MLAMAAKDSNVMTMSWDVSTAFLHAPMDEELYIEQPVGYEKEGKEKVCRMRKSMYGTKQASRNWHKTVHDVLTSKSVGFVQSKSDSKHLHGKDEHGGLNLCSPCSHISCLA